MNILTTINKKGIVNQMQIAGDSKALDNKTQIQLIWNGEIHATLVGLNSEPCEHGGNIKDYRAIYLNGVMIVKHGKVHPRKWWDIF